MAVGTGVKVGVAVGVVVTVGVPVAVGVSVGVGVGVCLALRGPQPDAAPAGPPRLAGSEKTRAGGRGTGHV